MSIPSPSNVIYNMSESYYLSYYLAQRIEYDILSALAAYRILK